MYRLRHFILLQSLILILFNSFCYAQTGNAYTVRGVVMNEEDGETLPGVAISVGETSQRAVTNLDGKFVVNLTSSPVHSIFHTLG